MIRKRPCLRLLLPKNFSPLCLLTLLWSQINTVKMDNQLKKLLSFELHMSCYQLTIEAGTVFHTRTKQGHILTADDDILPTYMWLRKC